MHVRNSARAVLLNENGQFLLFKFYFKSHPDQALWVTPGGGLDPGEDFESALARELFEETGLSVTSDACWVWTREILIQEPDQHFLSHERYFLIRVDQSSISLDHLTENEKRTLVEYRWWYADEIAQSDEEFRPRAIGELVKELQAGNIPHHPLRIE